MKINFKDMLLTGIAPFNPYCFADDDPGDGAGGDDGSGGGSGGGDGDGSDGDQGEGGDQGGDGEGDDGGKPAAGLMSNADGKDEQEGDKDSGKTLEFTSDGKTETLTVPAKFVGEDGEINQGAILKSALDAGKSVRQLQNDLAEAKKGVISGDAPETAEEYLSEDVIKDGVYQKPEGVGKLSDIASDDPGLVGFTEIAKKAGLSTEQFKVILSETMLMTDGFMDEPFNAEAEAEKFGKNAKGVANANRTWADGMLERGDISQAEWTHLLNMGQTAVGLSVVNKMRLQGGGQNIPINSAGVNGELPSTAEWYASMPDRNKDPDAYSKWQQQGEEIFGTAPAGTSQAGHGMPASRGGATPAQSGSNTRTRNR